MSQEKIEIRMSTFDPKSVIGTVTVKVEEEPKKEETSTEPLSSNEDSQKDPYWSSYNEFLVNLA